MRRKTPIATYRKLKPMFLDTIESLTGATGEEGTFESEYGTIWYRAYDDWVPFQLKQFEQYEHTNMWLGWRHWKQNFHTFATYHNVDLGDARLALTQHILDFYRDHGHGTLTTLAGATNDH